jgi:hypothetical protein
MYQSSAGSTKVAGEEMDSDVVFCMMLGEVCRSVIGG